MLEHCLEWLRVTTLCRGDTTLTTFAWSKHDPPRLESHYPVPHQCVDSERLLAWSRDRAVDSSQTLLVCYDPSCED